VGQPLRSAQSQRKCSHCGIVRRFNDRKEVILPMQKRNYEALRREMPQAGGLTAIECQFHAEEVCT
jgi:hypothetical protein